MVGFLDSLWTSSLLNLQPEALRGFQSVAVYLFKLFPGHIQHSAAYRNFIFSQIILLVFINSEGMHIKLEQGYHFNLNFSSPASSPDIIQCPRSLIHVVMYNAKFCCPSILDNTLDNWTSQLRLIKIFLNSNNLKKKGGWVGGLWSSHALRCNIYSSQGIF